MPETETILEFSKRMGLSETLIRQYAKQGLLPIIPVGKKHVKVLIDGAREAVRQIAQAHANELAATMPVPISSYYVNENKVYRGRPPGISRHKRSNEGR
jgi:hypothetical protein